MPILVVIAMLVAPVVSGPVAAPWVVAQVGRERVVIGMCGLALLLVFWIWDTRRAPER